MFPFWSTPSISLLNLDNKTYEWVDTNKFDLVLKKEYVEEEIKKLEAEIGEIEQRKKNIVGIYDKKITELNDRITDLKQK